MLSEHDLERDLQSSKMILAKVQTDRYAQNLYAAMCNMRWQKSDVWPVLKDELWSCTWRSSGGLVARLQGQGDYLTWYCSGIFGSDWGDGKDEIEGYVPEGTVTDEIKVDLAALGWRPVPWNDEEL